MSMEKWKKGVSSLILWVASFQTSGTILSKTLVERIEYQLRQWHYATIMKHVERAVGWWNKRTPTKNCLRKNIIYIIYIIYIICLSTLSLSIYIYVFNKSPSSPSFDQVTKQQPFDHPPTNHSSGLEALQVMFSKTTLFKPWARLERWVDFPGRICFSTWQIQTGNFDGCNLSCLMDGMLKFTILSKGNFGSCWDTSVWISRIWSVRECCHLQTFCIWI